MLRQDDLLRLRQESLRTSNQETTNVSKKIVIEKRKFTFDFFCNLVQEYGTDFCLLVETNQKCERISDQIPNIRYLVMEIKFHTFQERLKTSLNKSSDVIRHVLNLCKSIKIPIWSEWLNENNKELMRLVKKVFENALENLFTYVEQDTKIFEDVISELNSLLSFKNVVDKNSKNKILGYFYLKQEIDINKNLQDFLLIFKDLSMTRNNNKLLELYKAKFAAFVDDENNIAALKNNLANDICFSVLDIFNVFPELIEKHKTFYTELVKLLLFRQFNYLKIPEEKYKKIEKATSLNELKLEILNFLIFSNHPSKNKVDDFCRDIFFITPKENVIIKLKTDLMQAEKIILTGIVFNRFIFEKEIVNLTQQWKTFAAEVLVIIQTTDLDRFGRVINKYSSRQVIGKNISDAETFNQVYSAILELRNKCCPLWGNVFTKKNKVNLLLDNILSQMINLESPNDDIKTQLAALSEERKSNYTTPHTLYHSQKEQTSEQKVTQSVLSSKISKRK